jgi:hypothetical protein
MGWAILGVNVVFGVAIIYLVRRMLGAAQAFGKSWTEMFDRRDWRYAREDFVLDYPFPDLIWRAEDVTGIRLSGPARRMLLIPLMEMNDSENIDYETTQQSIIKILEATRENPDPRDTRERRRTSVSVIRGFYATFCDIPPFCSRTDDSSRPQ